MSGRWFRSQKRWTWATPLIVAGLVVAACDGSAGSGAVSTGTTPNALVTTSPPATAHGSVVTTDTRAANGDASAGTLPPGSPLPGDAECAVRVTAAVEVRAKNATFNQTRGRQKGLAGTYLARVTGDFSGATDEILQWAACKWGIAADIVRAQAAKESYWTMSNLGDFGSDAASCPPDHPLGADGTKGQCPESVGILQVRYGYHGPPAGLDTWPEAATSTAYNADYTYAVWRTCFEGEYMWLNDAEHIGTYASGDVWGCLGVWFAGRWRTEPAEQYIAAVQAYVRDRIWTTDSFISYR